MSTTKGRKAPTPTKIPATITVDQLAKLLATEPGLYTLEYRHSRGCPTVKSQRIDECTCPDSDLEVFAGRMVQA